MKIFIVTLTFFIIQVSFAKAPPGKWECRAYDANNRSYSSIATKRQVAIDKAYNLCRNNSKHRFSCKTAQSYCTQGPLSLIEDRCIVSDRHGKSWNTTGINACKTAVLLCNQWQFKNGINSSSNCIIRHR